MRDGPAFTTQPCMRCIGDNMCGDDDDSTDSEDTSDDEGKRKTRREKQDEIQEERRRRERRRILRAFFMNAVRRVATKLGITQGVVASASLFFIEFYAKLSPCKSFNCVCGFAHHDPRIAFAACIFLAAKLHECPVKSTAICDAVYTLFRFMKKKGEDDKRNVVIGPADTNAADAAAMKDAPPACHQRTHGDNGGGGAGKKKEEEEEEDEEKMKTDIENANMNISLQTTAPEPLVTPLAVCALEIRIIEALGFHLMRSNPYRTVTRICRHIHVEVFKKRHVQHGVKEKHPHHVRRGSGLSAGGSRGASPVSRARRNSETRTNTASMDKNNNDNEAKDRPSKSRKRPYTQTDISTSPSGISNSPSGVSNTPSTSGKKPYPSTSTLVISTATPTRNQPKISPSMHAVNSASRRQNAASTMGSGMEVATGGEEGGGGGRPSTPKSKQRSTMSPHSNAEVHLPHFAWSCVNDTYVYRPDMHLRYPPGLIALAAVFAACVESGRRSFEHGKGITAAEMHSWLDSMQVNVRHVFNVGREIAEMWEETKTLNLDISAADVNQILTDIRVHHVVGDATSR